MVGGLLAVGCDLDTEDDELVSLGALAVEDALATSHGQASPAVKVHGKLLPSVVAWDKSGTGDGVEDHGVLGVWMCLALARLASMTDYGRAQANAQAQIQTFLTHASSSKNRLGKRPARGRNGCTFARGGRKLRGGY